jgi:hypothetical protein
MFRFRVWIDLQYVLTSQEIPFGADTVHRVDDYFNAGYGRIIMVPRVKLAYDKVRMLHSPPYFPPLTPTRSEYTT